MTVGYTTHDSGSRETYSTGMRRDTQKGKARFDLLIPEDVPYEDQLLTRIANLMARGAEKYGDRNWESGFDKEALKRARSSAIRHFMQWFMGADDGEDHAAGAFFNILQTEYLMTLKKQESDAVVVLPGQNKEDEEVVDIVSKDDHVIGQTLRSSYDAFVASQSGYLRGVGVFIVSPEDFKVCIPTRAKHLTIKPGALDFSAAGHVKHNETYREAALRELKEETGIHAEDSELVDLGTLLSDKIRFRMHVFGVMTASIPMFDINEFSDDQWLSIMEAEALLRSGVDAKTLLLPGIGLLKEAGMF